MNRPFVSVVSPVYRGEKMVSELVQRCIDGVSKISPEYEIILVNDASPDGSWAEILRQCAANPRVKGLNLSRNFGQHYAISAGLEAASGEWVIVLDCDLQDRPEEFINLYNKALEGFDIVQARRINRKDSARKQLTGIVFHAVFDYLSGTKTDRALSNMGIYSRKVIDEFNRMPEASRSFGTLLSYLGFRKTTLDVEHSERAEGRSSYTLGKLLKLSGDIMIAGSNKPLRIAVKLGFLISAVAFILAIYNLVAKLTGIITLPGYTTTVFSIWFVGGLLMLMLGVLGLYIGKIFDQVKGRQLYIVMDRVNFEE